MQKVLCPIDHDTQQSWIKQQSRSTSNLFILKRETQSSWVVSMTWLWCCADETDGVKIYNMLKKRSTVGPFNTHHTPNIFTHSLLAYYLRLFIQESSLAQLYWAECFDRKHQQIFFFFFFFLINTKIMSPIETVCVPIFCLPLCSLSFYASHFYFHRLLR